MAGFLGIKVFDQLHGALDIGKESGDSFSLSICGPSGFYGCLLGQDTLC